jgi:hypothetical protein
MLLISNFVYSDLIGDNKHGYYDINNKFINNKLIQYETIPNNSLYETVRNNSLHKNVTITKIEHLNENNINNEVEENNIQSKELELDYFVGFTWRLRFFYICLISSTLAYIFNNKQQIFQSFFWTMMLRFMTVGGVIWTIIYGFSWIILALTSKFITFSWINGIEIHQPWWHFFLMINSYQIYSSYFEEYNFKFVVLF